MSMHRVPLTPTEEAGLHAHGLQRNIGKPSQLVDVFRQGVAWGRAAAAEQAAERARATEIVNGEPAAKLREAIAQRVADVGKPTGA